LAPFFIGLDISEVDVEGEHHYDEVHAPTPRRAVNLSAGTQRVKKR
jgi:hypothetical protein